MVGLFSIGVEIPEGPKDIRDIEKLFDSSQYFFMDEGYSWRHTPDTIYLVSDIVCEKGVIRRESRWVPLMGLEGLVFKYKEKCQSHVDMDLYVNWTTPLNGGI